MLLGRVKTLRLLTLPCQKTNPDGVICGGKRWRFSLFWMLSVFDGVICGGKALVFDIID